MKIDIQLVTDDGTQYTGTAILSQIGKKSRSTKQEDPAVHDSPNGNKCPNILNKLWREGTFKVAQSLAEITTVMEKLGYNFPKPTVSNALARSHFLTRHGTVGSFRWKQKHPAG